MKSQFKNKWNGKISGKAIKFKADKKILGTGERALQSKIGIVPKGKISFKGWDKNRLMHFAVIPESPDFYLGKVFTPKNQKYNNVDGFFWKNEPEMWYKIPDDCHAIISLANWKCKKGIFARVKGVKCNWSNDAHWAKNQNPFIE